MIESRIEAEGYASEGESTRILRTINRQQRRAAQLQREVGGTNAEIAVLDGKWRVLAANAAWRERARTHPVGALLQVGQDFQGFCRSAPVSDTSEAEILIEGMREIDVGGTRHFLRAGPPSPTGQYQFTIDRNEVDGRELAIVSRMEVTELIELRQARVQLDERLARTQARLFRAEARLLRAQEEERQRVARELHNTAAQYLVGMSLAVARLRAAQDDALIASVADDLGDLLDQLHRDLRGLTFLLHPPQIDQVGLHAALASLCDGFGKRTGLTILLDVQGVDRRRGSAVEAAIYRVVQEALSNIHRHARAKTVKIRFSDRDNALLVVIADDGVGLRASRRDSERPSRLGVGIAGMIARMDELGGRVTVRSRHGGRRGAVVAAGVPREGGGQSFLPASASARP